MTSRAFRVRGPSRPAALLPLVDLANHSFDPNAEVVPGGRGGVAMVAKRQVRWGPRGRGARGEGQGGRGACGGGGGLGGGRGVWTGVGWGLEGWHQRPVTFGKIPAPSQPKRPKPNKPAAAPPAPPPAVRG